MKSFLSVINLKITKIQILFGETAPQFNPTARIQDVSKPSASFADRPTKTVNFSAQLWKNDHLANEIFQ